MKLLNLCFWKDLWQGILNLQRQNKHAPWSLITYFYSQRWLKLIVEGHRQICKPITIQSRSIKVFRSKGEMNKPNCGKPHRQNDILFWGHAYLGGELPFYFFVKPRIPLSGLQGSGK